MTDHGHDKENIENLRSPEIIALVSGKLEDLRKRLLDSTRRNPLIDIKFRPTSNSFLRVVDELPDILRYNLTAGQDMRLVPLPALEDELPDEITDSFRDALFIAKQEDLEFLDAVEKIDTDGANAEEKVMKAERKLKDRLRVEFGLSPRQTKEELSLAEHARLHGISPNYLLPLPDEVHQDGRHEDHDIQTLLLPDRLSRSAKAILEKGRSFERETGVNVLHAAFGLLEWKDPAERERYVSPLLLLEIRMDRRQSPQGAEFFIRGSDQVFVNTNLGLKFQSEHRLALPEYESGNVETYFDAIEAAQPSGWHWHVRREVAFGIFPSSKIAMYHDLDPSKRPVAENEVVARLLATTGTGDGSYAKTYETDDPDVAVKVPYLVMDADASQYSALVDVAGGNNLAIEGPPGSGKSQTIVNLVAAALAEGKKVLFVAEKLTALDVVKNRLESAGLGNFILPLQAGHSTTEAVYESIAKRLEMGQGESRSRIIFQSRQGALEKSRAVLQSYLDTLSAQLGSTGLTIYQVIGHAIATAETREQLPRDIRRISINSVSMMGETQVEAFVSEARVFGQRLGRITQMPVIWRISTAPITSRDQAEDLSAAAGELANELKNFTQDIMKSEIAFLMSKNPLLVDMDPIGRILSTAAREEHRVSADIITTLNDPVLCRAARDLCRQIQDRRAIVAHLGHVFKDPEGRDIEENIKSAAQFAGEHRSSLDPAWHKSRLASLLIEIEAAKATILAAQRLPQAWTHSERTLLDIQLAARRLAAQPFDVLRMRRAEPLGSISEVAIEMERTNSKLSVELERLKRFFFSTGEAHNPEEIRRTADTIETAGFLGRMSSPFKSACNTYTNILGGRRGVERTDMVQQLRDYSAWLEARSAFDNSVRFKDHFGGHFKGLNTDISVIPQIVSFYAVCKEVSGGSADLKYFLETGDLDPVVAFAQLNTVPAVLKSQLEDQLRSLEHDAEQEQSYVAESETHLGLFRERTVMTIFEIDDIMHKKAVEVALAEKIEASPAKDFLGSRFAGLMTDADVLVNECEIAEEVLAIHASEFVVAAIRSGRIGEITIDFKKFADRRAQIEKKVANFVTDIGLPSGIDTAAGLSGRIKDLEVASLDSNSLLDRAQLKRAEDSLRDQGLGDLVDFAISEGGNFDPLTLGPIVRALVARSMADAAYQKYGEALQGYDGQDFDRIRAEIAEKDRDLITMSKLVILNQLLSSANPPAGTNIGRKSGFTEMSLIYNELHKKKRRIGLRDLTRRAGFALLELKPCWMMSPLAVAQYLHEGMIFDLVVIDEASQMTPENAVGAISRAHQVVVVGDTKQLPPTSFFQKLLDDTDTDEDLREDSESILDMANVAFMPVRQLRWHYRSRHSALIQFSNQWMYKGELTIFPSAQEDHPDLGVELVEVPGTYRGRRNEIEARAVIIAAVHHMTHRSELSLGICTMNTDQKDLLIEEFERERDRNPKVRAFVEIWEEKNDSIEEFFIKNIETIQGDERDVMIISTLYGPESLGGKMHQRFGPINTAQGHRRLNVLFTRAKRKIVTFTSMKPTDILVDDSKNLGVRMFRAWLEYCKTGRIPDRAGPRSSTESPFEDFVATQIERLGCEVVPQVGVAGYRVDLGVRHPDWPYGYILGVECDGAAYHSSKSSRDRDRLRQEVLEGLGWKLHRIWSTDWFRNPRKEIEVLKGVIDAALHIAKANGITHSVKFDHLVEPNRIEEDATFNTTPVGEPNLLKFPTDISADTISELRQSPRQASLPIDLPVPNDLFSLAAKVVPATYVGIGSKVKVENITEGGRKLAFTIVEGENSPDVGKVGVHTPLGQALLEAQIGDKVEFQVGSHIKEVRVLDIQ